MKFSYMCISGYDGPVVTTGWPMPSASCDRETARRSLLGALNNAKIAEASGFDWVSVSEHHYSPIALTPNPMVMAGALSQATSRVKIAVLGPILPLNNPVRLAEELAMLDSLSNGRIVVLFLRGTPNEQVTYENVVERSRSMTQEGIDLILKIWTTPEAMKWHGKEYQFEHISVWPRPLQEPHPVVFGSGNSDESIAFAAERKLSIAMSFAPLEVVRRWIDLYYTKADQAGWRPTADNILYRHIAHIGETDALANEQYDAAVAARAGETAKLREQGQEMGGPAAPANAMFKPFLFGGPDTVKEKIKAVRDAGIGVLDIAFGIPGSANQGRAIELMGKTVLPEAQRW